MQSNVEFYERAQANGADDDSPRTLDVVLDPPIEANGKTYDSLHIEEPSTKQVRQAEQELTGDYGPHYQRNFQIALVSQASGAPRPVIEGMRISQLLECYNFLRRFSGHGPAIGQI